MPFAECKKLLASIFVNDDESDRLWSLAKNYSQAKDQAVDEYISIKAEKIAEWDPRVSEAVKVDMIISNLAPYLKESVAESMIGHSKLVKKVRDIAIDRESFNKTYNRFTPDKNNKQFKGKFANKHDADDSKLNSVPCAHCKKDNHAMKDCWKLKGKKEGNFKKKFDKGKNKPKGQSPEVQFVNQSQFPHQYYQLAQGIGQSPLNQAGSSGGGAFPEQNYEV